MPPDIHSTDYKKLENLGSINIENLLHKNTIQNYFLQLAIEKKAQKELEHQLT